MKTLFVCAYEIVFLSLYCFSNEYLKPKKKLLVAEVFLCLSNVLCLYYSADSIQHITRFLINFFIQAIMFLYFYKFKKTYKNKLIFYKFSKNDYFIFSIMVMLLGIGVFSFFVIQKYLGLFLMTLFIIFAAKILPIERFLTSLIVVLLSLILVSQNNFLFMMSFVLGFVSLMIKDFNKWIFGFSGFSISLVLLLIFKNFNIFNIISVFFAFFIYILFPSKLVDRFSGLFENEASNIIIQNYQDKKVFEIKNKLFYMSTILTKMQSGFKELIIGKLDRNKASKELAIDVINKCCATCENYRLCFLENINKQAMFENMLLKAIQKQQIDSCDMMSGIQTYCSKSGIVMTEINQMARLFLKYEKAMKSEDESKLIISSEIGNFADIFKNFANNIKNSAKINKKLSKNLKEGLINSLIDAKECMIFENQNGIEEVNIIASNTEILKKDLAFTVSKVVRNSVKLNKIYHLEHSGLSLASFIVKSKIDVQFSVASKAKEQKNGDNSVICKLKENRYFVAIADGMGHGERANQMSKMVLDLIKSMFEVGLDSRLILESVNKLLIPAGLDNFSTLDAVIIDLDLNECLFIKLGASVSVLKHQNTSELIKCDSLPIGIVENAKPTIIRKQFFAGDKIFLASDGVVDSFSSVSSFATFINDAKIYNMQKFLDNVLFDAEAADKQHLDDMTIIGVNLLKN
ncbi:MAG: SpoIIE family protein phosphatase [Clostridia bacterium]|nr:SpoIIE family protein phosphatase [Clostridia bacterium]